MDPSTDAVVEDVRYKRHMIDRRIDEIRGRIDQYNPKRLPWQAWAERAWPVFATAMLIWMWRRYRYNHRFMRLP